MGLYEIDKITKMTSYWTLFLIFSKIGAFTLGGGYAMFPLIQQEIVDKRQWIDRREFLDLLAIAQSAPGIIAVNIAIFVGYKLKGVKGSLVTTLGTVLPSFVAILLIALFFQEFKDNIYVQRIFMGIRPVTVALIAAPVLQMGRAACEKKILWLIPLTVAAAIWLAGISPVGIVLAAGFSGWLGGWIKERRK